MSAESEGKHVARVTQGALLAVLCSGAVAAGLGWWWWRRGRRSHGAEEYLGLRAACARGDVERVRQLLLLGTTSERLGDHVGGEEDVFATCARHGQAECLRLLLHAHLSSSSFADGGHSPLLRHTAEGWTALHVACINGNEATVRTIISSLQDRQTFDVNMRALQNRWTPLHVAAAMGHRHLAFLLVDECSADVDARDVVDHTPLIIASCNGFIEVVRLLLQAGADTTVRTSRALESALHMAAKNGHTSVLRLLASACPMPTTDSLDHQFEFDGGDGAGPLYYVDEKGSTLLHAAANSHAVAQGDLSCIQLVLELTGDRFLNVQKRDGATALHIAATRGNAAVVQLLITRGATLGPRTKFGTTPLHEACAQGHPSAVEVLLGHGAPVHARDNDGLTPLHTTCSSLAASPHRTRVVELLLDRGADPNFGDGGNSTALHALAFCPTADDDVAACTHRLLVGGNSFSAENEIEWTPLHCAFSQHGNERCRDALLDFLQSQDPQFLQSFDKSKPRGKPRKREVYACPLSVEERHAVLEGDVSLQGIARKILSGSVRRIIVMTGAGISVEAGIPDFRSPHTGLYTRSQDSGEKGGYGDGDEGGDKDGVQGQGQGFNHHDAINTLKSQYGLATVGQVFDASVFESDPAPFWAVVRQLFLPVKRGSCRPTATHWFIRLLQDKGLLLRNYTQNIDMLEHACAIDPQRVVEAHGSLARARCTNPACEEPVADMKHHVWEVVERGAVPYCPACGDGAVRPDVVFFGEPLPRKFFELNLQDFKTCDLLIVMGTSLTVYPFAGLVNEVPPTTPRLLINKTSVGVWTLLHSDDGSQQTEQGGSAPSAVETYRDVQVLGSCDAGIWQLASALGWDKELAGLMHASG